MNIQDIIQTTQIDSEAKSALYTLLYHCNQSTDKKVLDSYHALERAVKPYYDEQ